MLSSVTVHGRKYLLHPHLCCCTFVAWTEFLPIKAEQSKRLRRRRQYHRQKFVDIGHWDHGIHLNRTRCNSMASYLSDSIAQRASKGLVLGNGQLAGQGCQMMRQVLHDISPRTRPSRVINFHGQTLVWSTALTGWQCGKLSRVCFDWSTLTF
jgi:hypothetical protein